MAGIRRLKSISESTDLASEPVCSKQLRLLLFPRHTGTYPPRGIGQGPQANKLILGSQPP